MAQQYEPDEFDEIAAQGGPVGVHRAPRSVWARLLPPLLAFLIAGLITLAVVALLWNRDIVGPNSEADPVPTVTATAEEEGEPEPTDPAPDTTTDAAPDATTEPPAPEPTPEPTDTAEPEPQIIYDAQVHVRNGARIQGLAGAQQEELEAADYTNIEANNIEPDLVPDGANTVTYTDERLADTAQDVADTLGIEAVEGGGTPGGAEIEVLLASDPDA